MVVTLSGAAARVLVQVRVSRPGKAIWVQGSVEVKLSSQGGCGARV